MHTVEEITRKHNVANFYTVVKVSLQNDLIFFKFIIISWVADRDVSTAYLS